MMRLNDKLRTGIIKIDWSAPLETLKGDPVVLIADGYSSRRERGPEAWYFITYVEGDNAPVFAIVTKDGDALWVNDDVAFWGVPMVRNVLPKEQWVCMYRDDGGYWHIGNGGIPCTKKQAEEWLAYVEKTIDDPNFKLMKIT